MIPVPVASVFGTPLEWIATGKAGRSLLTAIRNVVAVVVRQRSIMALAVVDDAVGVAVGGPFDDVRKGKTVVIVPSPVGVEVE